MVTVAICRDNNFHEVWSGEQHDSKLVTIEQSQKLLSHFNAYKIVYRYISYYYFDIDFKFIGITVWPPRWPRTVVLF